MGIAAPWLSNPGTTMSGRDFPPPPKPNATAILDFSPPPRGAGSGYPFAGSPTGLACTSGMPGMRRRRCNRRPAALRPCSSARACRGPHCWRRPSSRSQPPVRSPRAWGSPDLKWAITGASSVAHHTPFAQGGAIQVAVPDNRHIHRPQWSSLRGDLRSFNGVAHGFTDFRSDSGCGGEVGGG